MTETILPTATSQYRLQEGVVRLFEGTNLALRGLRLAHALTERALGPLGLPSLAPKDTGTPALLTAEILRYLWPSSTNDLDSVHAGLASLAATDLFAELRLNEARVVSQLEIQALRLR